MNDAKTPPDSVAETDDQLLSPSTLYDPMPRADLTVPPMMHPDLTRLHAEIARLREEVERQKAKERRWLQDIQLANRASNEAEEKARRLRADLTAMTAERDDMVVLVRAMIEQEESA